MKYFFRFVLLLVLLCQSVSYSQSNNVVAGPMVSFVDSYGTQIWFLLKEGAQKIQIDITDYEKDQLLEYDFDVVNHYNLNKYIPFTVVLDDLSPNHEYIASVYVDNVFIKEIDIFTKRPHLDDLQFLIGHNSGVDSDKIFSQICGHKQFLILELHQSLFQFQY